MQRSKPRRTRDLGRLSAQRMLKRLDYLAACLWTVAQSLCACLAQPAFSWYTRQTIAGAVATGSHGSSMTHGSLSDQVSGGVLEDGHGGFVHHSCYVVCSELRNRAARQHSGFRHVSPCLL
jgi:hypothetical protein